MADQIQRPVYVGPPSKRRPMPDPKPTQPDTGAFDNALGMIAKVGTTVAAYRQSLRDAGVADESADRMTERLNDELMGLIGQARAQATGGSETR